MARFLVSLLGLLAVAVSSAFAQTTVVCSGACTVTHVLSMQNTGTLTAVLPPMNETQVADYMALWGLFLGVGVTVLIAKAFYSRFRLSKYEG